MNFVLERGFVKEEDDLHIFVRHVNNCIQTRRDAENAETIALMVCTPKIYLKKNSIYLAVQIEAF